MGVHVAYAPARHGLGKTLLAAHPHQGVTRTQALEDWRAFLVNIIKHGPKGFIGCRFRGLARSVLQDFPSTAVLDVYLYPITSSPSELKFLSTMYRFCPRTPSIGFIDLPRICGLQFAWGTYTSIQDKFGRMVWPAVALRAFVRDIVTKRGYQDSDPTTKAILASRSWYVNNSI